MRKIKKQNTLTGMRKAFKEARSFLYNNAILIKRKNKRLIVIDDDDGNFCIISRICDGSLEERALTRILKGKAVETFIKYERASAIMMAEAIMELSAKDIKKL